MVDFTDEDKQKIAEERAAFYATLGLPDAGVEPAGIDYLKLLAKAGELDMTETDVQALLADQGCTAFLDDGEAMLLDATWKAFHAVYDHMFYVAVKKRVERTLAEKKAAKNGEVLAPEPIKEEKLDAEALMTEYRKLKEWGLSQGIDKTTLFAWWGATTDVPEDLKPSLPRLKKFREKIGSYLVDRLDREFAGAYDMKFGFEVPFEWQQARLSLIGSELPEEIEINGSIFKRCESGKTPVVLAGGASSSDNSGSADGGNNNDTVADAGERSDTGTELVNTDVDAVPVGDDTNDEGSEDKPNTQGVGDTLPETGDTPVSDGGTEGERSIEEEAPTMRYQRLPEKYGWEKEKLDEFVQNYFGDEKLSHALLDQLEEVITPKPEPKPVSFQYHESGFRINSIMTIGYGPLHEHGEIDIPPVLQSFGWTEMPTLNDPDIDEKIERIGDRMASMLDDCARYRANAEARCKPKEEGVKFYQQVFGKLLEAHAKNQIKYVKSGKNAGKPVKKTVVYATFSMSFEKTGGIWISSKETFEAHLKKKPELMQKLGVKEITKLDYKPEQIIKAITDKVVQIDELAGMADVAVNELGSYTIKGSKKEKVS